MVLSRLLASSIALSALIARPPSAATSIAVGADLRRSNARIAASMTA
jgi:hypothetical protein